MSAVHGRELKLGIVGATGAVGEQVAELLSERGFHYSEVRLFASASAASQTVTLGGQDALVEELSEPAVLAGLDVVFLCAPPSVNSEIIRARPGPLLIAVGFAGSDPAATKPVAPGLTERGNVQELAGDGLIMTPHPAAYAAAVVLSATGLASDFVSGVVMLGASAGGRHEIELLVRQSTDLLNGRLDHDEDEPQRAFNLFMTGNESHLAGVIAAQTASLLSGQLKMTLQVLRAPVFHGGVLILQTGAALDSGKLRERLRTAPGLLMMGDDESAADLAGAVGQEAIVVKPVPGPGGLSLICLFDNARLAALCGVWAAENFALASNLS
jgi:aspartate-semialdehyde dehydrogenase